MKLMSLAAIFWCILIPSSETSKENAGTQAGPTTILPCYNSNDKGENDPMKFWIEGCHCDCSPYKNTSKRIYWKQQIENDCNCLYVVDPMPVPSHDTEAYCLLCDCKAKESSNTAIMIILIIFLLVFLTMLVFNIVQHFIHKPDAYTNSLHNEEESEDPLI
ncbi:proton-transporting V-type ATPase complex assembly regulator TMEM9-like [Vipera latastei]